MIEKKSKYTLPLGNRIRSLREKRGLKLTVLAKRANISKSYLSHLERGRVNNPTLDVVQKIAKGLRVDLPTLFQSEESYTSAYASPLKKEYLEMLRQENISDAALLLNEIVKDPDIPKNYRDEIEDKIISYARWLRNEVKKNPENKES